MRPVGYLNPNFIIISVGILVLFWAFGSYVVYSITVENAKQCIPPLDGCIYISKSANYHISSIFYRATILPTTMLLLIANYYILQYLKRYTDIQKDIYIFLFTISIVIAPITLNITEALPNGSVDYGFKKLHRIFAGIAFFTMIVFELITSIYIYKKYKSIYSLVLIIIAISEIIFVILPELSTFHNIRAVSQWNLMITISIWFIYLGYKANDIFKIK